MIRTSADFMRPFVAAVVLGVLLDASACGLSEQTRPDPLRFSSAQHFLRADRVKMLFDLKRELEDATAGPNGPNGLPLCYNLNQNVNVEITRMDNFASGTVIGDVTAMQNDVTTMRGEQADFEHDINDFVNDGVLRPTYEPLTITAITGKIEDAVRDANATIMAIRADLRAAHSSAGSLAVGRCAVDRPEGMPSIQLVR